MSYPLLKSLHIIGVVTWFAGLFYIVRLFVYLAETLERPEHEQAVLLPQLQLMARRLWFGITWPSGIFATGFGLGLLAFFPLTGWLHLKLAMVAGLWVYHLGCHWLLGRFLRGEPAWSSRSLRIYNEVATLFLVAIVFVVVFKDALVMAYALAGLGVLSAVLMAAIVAYRRLREAA
ncbi:MAG: CopD family protein [Proteobacteria bacterium]|nr:CopD family protein [Pseudomonadota bacterium]